MARKFKLRRRRAGRKSGKGRSGFKKRVRRIILSTAESKRIITSWSNTGLLSTGVPGTVGNMNMLNGFPQLILQNFNLGVTNSTVVGNSVVLTGHHGKYNLCFQVNGNQQEWWTQYPIQSNCAYQWYTRIMIAKVKSKNFNVYQAASFVGAGGQLAFPPVASTTDPFHYPYPALADGGTGSIYQFQDIFKIIKDKWITHNLQAGLAWTSADTAFANIQSISNMSVRFKWAKKEKRTLKFAKGNATGGYDASPTNYNYFVFIMTNLPPVFTYNLSGYHMITYKDP